MSIPIDLDGRTVLITGASQGIGACMARRFHQAGAVVWINHPGFVGTADDAGLLARELGDRAHIVSADVADAGQTQCMMRRIVEVSGGLDFLVNNAAILRDKTMAKMSAEDWQAVINVNLTGVFHCCKFALEILNDGGAIVSIGSIAALQGFYGQVNYASAKAGVMAMMRVLSRETARRGIRVNSIAPGVVATSMAEQIPDSIRAEMLKNVPLGRFGRPEEIADAAVFLCSDLASYITGQTLEVNGGWRG
jgi:3-oxoacyl-[acyl-carrier protein] reductase